MTEVSVPFIHTNNPGNLSPSSLSTTWQGINGSAHTASTHTGLANTEYTTVRFYNSRPQSEGVPEFESSSVIIGTIVAASALFVVVIATLIFLKKRRDAQLRERTMNRKKAFEGGVGESDSGSRSPSISVIEYGLPYQLPPVVKESDHGGYLSMPDEYLSRKSNQSHHLASQRRATKNLPLAQLTVSISNNGINVPRSANNYFVRGAHYRKSRSMEHLPDRGSGYIKPLNNMAILGSSQDSGIGDSMTLSSPTSIASVPAIVWSPELLDPVAALQHTIQGLLRQFHAIQNRRHGYCYASKYFAVGEFDAAGGLLHLKDSEPAELYIPPGALTKSTVVYMMVQYEESEPSVGVSGLATLSPVFECGPDGLQFQVPVELTVPHAATPGTEVAAVSRSPNTDSWKEDLAADGPAITKTDQGTITLKINHFTGFKISDVSSRNRGILRGPSSVTRSRIPVLSSHLKSPTSSTGSTGSTSIYSNEKGKELSLCVFTCSDKAKIYFATNSGCSSLLRDRIDHKEAKLGFTRDSDWKEFSFIEGKGGLYISAESRRSVYKDFNLSDRKILNAHYDCVEIIATEVNLVLDITFYQPAEKQCSTQFCIKLNRSTPEASLHGILPRLQNIEHAMSTLELQSLTHTINNNNHLEGTSGKYIRSVSDTRQRSPQESCDHGGACMCWKESPSRCPTESSLSPDYAHNPRGLQRKGTTRSQESGYESSINSPVSPLMGPETLEQSGTGPYPGAPYSNEDMSLTLELHTIHSGASPSQAPTHQVPPVPTPRNRQEYHGNDATHV